MGNSKEKNKLIYCVLFAIIVVCIIYVVDSNNFFKIGKRLTQNNGQASRMSIQEAKKENTSSEENEQQINQTENTTNIQESTEKQTKIEIPAKMGRYEVLGKLVIEKVNINKNILNVSDDEALKISAVKLCGPNINEIGNFCICGHNWKSMLKRALELQIGDTFCLIDRQTLNKVNYEIYDIYTCMPKDLECLSQNTDGKREATIITCNPGGITRLIIKGKEIKM